MNKILPLLLSLGLVSGLAHADASDIKARQQYMREWGGLSQKMGAMVKNGSAADFPAKEFARLAAQMGETAKEPWQHYDAGSRGAGSEAKAAVWEKPQEFEAAIRRFTQAVDKLQTASRGGRYDDVKAAFGQVGQSCKACHDKFKED